MADDTSLEIDSINKQLYKKNLELLYANKQLALLQRLYEIMSHTYQLVDLAQEFIDVIVKDLGFLNGAVALANPMQSHLQVVAVTKTKFDEEVLNQLGAPYETLQVSLHDSYNLAVKAYKTKERQETSDLYEVLRPAVTKDKCDRIAQITNTKSTVVYPLWFGQRTMGVFTIFVDKISVESSEHELQTLDRVATVFGVAIDRVILYQDLHKANEQLKVLDKRKDEFLNVAAHELRAPLTAVKGYLSMIKEGDAGEVSDKVAEFLDGALEGSEREIRLVNNLLNVSRIEEGRLIFKLGPVDLAKVVQTVYDEHKLDGKNKGLEYRLEIAETVQDKVYVDQDRIHEIVANLISNAIKYTDKGFVKVKLFNLQASTVRLEVADSGYGISADERKKVFGKFYRSESSAGKVLGTGLGLYIVKLLIKEFKGDLGFDSEEGVGSTFWIELPLDKGGPHPEFEEKNKEGMKEAEVVKIK